MEEAEKKRFHEMYDRHYEVFGKTYRELVDTLSDDCQVVLDQEVLDRVGFMINEQALLLGSLHQIGKLRPTTLEKCIQRIFDLLRGFFWSVHRVLFIAGNPLARILCELIKELKDCALDLLKCTIGYGPYGSPNDWDGVTDLAIKLFNMYESFVNNPKTSIAAMGIATLQVANDMEGALCEMEKKAGFSMGKSNEKADSMRNSLEEERTVMALVIPVVSVTLLVIKDLTRVGKIWKDAGLSKSIKVMEELLMRSISLRDGINEIEDRLCPLKDVHILLALKCMKASLNFITNKLQPFKHGLAEFDHKLIILRRLMGELNGVFGNRVELS